MKSHTQDRNCRRVLILVMDGVGVGELPDAADFGDTGSCTLGNIAEAAGGLNLPSLAALGLGNIIPISGVPPVDEPLALMVRCFATLKDALASWK